MRIKIWEILDKKWQFLQVQKLRPIWSHRALRTIFLAGSFGRNYFDESWSFVESQCDQMFLLKNHPKTTKMAQTITQPILFI
jgi:hypothetical protein